MDDVLDDLTRIASRCERAAKVLSEEPLKGICQRLVNACYSVGEAWSGSWIGYQASVYTRDFCPRCPGEHFDSMWGEMDAYSSRTVGDWYEYPYDEVEKEILHRAHVANTTRISDAAKTIGKVFDECKRELLPTFDAVIETHQDSTLKGLREKLGKLKQCVSRSDYAKVRLPKQVMTHDMRAIQGHLQAPPHFSFEAWVFEQLSYSAQANELAAIARHAATYLQKCKKMKGKTVTKTEGPIFIGHGRSAVWRDLKDFLVDRLELDYEEFNSESTAGLSTKERLLEMLDKCCFAFIVMTAEDDRGDGSMHARENVVHEAGLFQGRYGFERAIILLEEGCAEFSNIQSIGQIRFQKGNFKACSEEIRGVLEREKIL